MKKRRRTPPAQLDIDIPLELAQRFAAHCASEGVTEREALEAALRKYFAGLQERALVAQKLDELEQSAAETERALKSLAQAYASFAGVASTPLDRNDDSVAERAALRRTVRKRLH